MFQLFFPNFLYHVFIGYLPAVEFDKFYSFDYLCTDFDALVFVNIDLLNFGSVHLPNIILHRKERNYNKKDNKSWPPKPKNQNHNNSHQNKRRNKCIKKYLAFRLNSVEIIGENVDDFPKFLCLGCVLRKLS